MPQHKPSPYHRLLKDLAAQRARRATARQYELALAAAPDPVRDHGLRAAHPRPLVSLGKRPGQAFSSWRTSPKKAWRFPSLEYANAGASYAVIVCDCDDRRRWGVGLAELPPPNWIVRRQSNDHAHIAWCLADPVHRYPEAEFEPLDYLAWVSGYYTATLGADAGYASVLSHNPAPRYRQDEFTTEWGSREPYSLSALANVIPFNWEPPAIDETAIGRNVDLFKAGMKWAGKQANAHLDVLAALVIANGAFAYPLPQSEVAAMAASIEGYRRKWAAHGWHAPAWIERQAARGRLGGIASGQTRRPGSAAETRPWETEGVSRPTWYRRAARGRLNADPARDAAIVADRAAGMTQAAIAAKHGMSIRGVRKLLRRVQISRIREAELSETRSQHR